MEYYYTKKENIDLINKELTFNDFEYRHLVKVLRKREGDKVQITDGELNVYECIIKKIGRDNLLCSILDTSYNLNEPNLNLSLYLSPLRNQSRLEFVIEKAVELGVSSVHPVITEHTVKKNLNQSIRTDRLQKIMIAAMGQSQRCFLPPLYETITFEQMMNENSEKKNKIVMYESSVDKSEVLFAKDNAEVSLLIGPEGGFSESEISVLKGNAWQIRSLGSRKLRAETAAIVSVFDIISKHD